MPMLNKGRPSAWLPLNAQLIRIQHIQRQPFLSNSCLIRWYTYCNNNYFFSWAIAIGISCLIYSMQMRWETKKDLPRKSRKFQASTFFRTSIRLHNRIISSLTCLSMYNLLLHFPIHHRAVMMNHIPATVLKFKDVSHIEWTINVNICFHGNPSHVCQNPSPYIPHLKVQSLLPVEHKLPTLHHCIIPAAWKIVLPNCYLLTSMGKDENEEL